jgi:hypothetical protein
VDNLEHLEHFAAHGGLIMAPEDMDALKSVLSELRAAREAVEVYMEEDELVYPAKQVKQFIAKKMKESEQTP